jgi:hypothetical protein
MKKQIFKGLLCIAAISLSVWACTKDNSATIKEDTTPQNLVFTDDQKDEARDFFARTLAKSCSYEMVQTFLKERALKKVNGDYEILYMMVRDRKLSNGKTFATVLQEQADNDLQKRDSKTTEDFFNLFTEKIDPSLTIYLYAPKGKTVNDWNPKTSKKVAFCLPSVDDEKAKSTGTYDVNGVKSTVDVKTHPQDFYIVVRANERYKFTLKNGQNFDNKNTSLNVRDEEYISCEDPYSGTIYWVTPWDCASLLGDFNNNNSGYPNRQSIPFSSTLTGTRSGSVCPE